MSLNPQHTFTLTFTSNARHVSISLADDILLNDLLDVFKLIALAATYHPDSWDQAIVDAADHIREQEGNLI